MTNQGYYRFPAIHGKYIYFISEDDIWCVADNGGIPRRLTAGLGEMGRIAVSPDGKWLAVTAREEKHTEVFVTSAEGGPLRRRTWLGADCSVRGFSPEGEIIFTSNAGQPFNRLSWMYHLPPEGGQPARYPFGPALDLSFGTRSRKVLGRHTSDPARWKRYRGGTAGNIWIDAEGSGQFRSLVNLKGNLASPMWIKERIFFISDHEGIGNIYSCDPAGGNVRRHTDHQEYFARWAATDGIRVAYQCGADIRVLDPETGEDTRVDIEWHGPSTQTQRRFIRANEYVDTFSIHPSGHSLALDCRGKPLTLGLWEGPVLQHGIPDGVRYRFPQWLHDGKTLVAVGDASGTERIVIFSEDGGTRTLEKLDPGRVVTMVASPSAPQVALTNHRRELLLIDLNAETQVRLDHSGYRRIEQLAWSPDGAWLAYDFATSRETSAIKLCEISSGNAVLASSPEFRDFAPAWDPEGKYLYFLSHRVFDPVYDTFYFDLNFPKSVKPCLVVLSSEEESPLVQKPHGFSEDESKAAEKKSEIKVRVDLEGIDRRILTLPVPEGIYRQIGGLSRKVLFTSFPVSGSLNRDWSMKDIAGGNLECFDFVTQKSETLLEDVNWFGISKDSSTFVYRSGKRFRAVQANGKIKKSTDNKPSRETGWIDLSRLRVSVEPRAEWAQMFRDVWRLQCEYFWVEDMCGVDWQRVYDRYAPLLKRVSTRSEFSDLIWEMQGELGTSHAYEFGGDHRSPPDFPLGYLGADFVYEPSDSSYRIAHIVRGDGWNSDQDSPLLSPGLNIAEGDRILAVNGRRLTAEISPESQLVHFSGVPIEITVAKPDGTGIRKLTVHTMRNESAARYREWVERNRRIVHERTSGRVGYVHIPDMGPRGFSEFHRYYSLEAERDSLIIDVRYNGGGHVSQLILEKLARKRLGYDFSRWGTPVPYPSESVLGPMVALTNEHAGSDGDMFSHAFKMLKLGPLVGKRTWGGVIGISPRHRLVDGSMTTQPEYSFWFEDVGWGVENHGTDPDIEVEITPQDYAEGRDPQLDKAIELIMRALESNPPRVPEPSTRPRLPLPQLPVR